MILSHLHPFPLSLSSGSYVGSSCIDCQNVEQIDEGRGHQRKHADIPGGYSLRVEDLKSELSGDYESLCKALMMPAADFCAKTMYKAMKGAGTDEDTLTLVLTQLDNEGIAAMKEAYSRSEC